MDNSPLKSTANEMFVQSKDTLKEVEKLTLDAFEEISERMLDSSKKMKTLLKENPALSIAAGVAVGFILGQLGRNKK